MLTTLPGLAPVDFEPALSESADEPFIVEDEHSLHLALTVLNRHRLSPAAPKQSWRRDLEDALALTMHEGVFLERERRRVASRAAEAPREAKAFAAWFDDLRDSGPGQYDPLFDYLADRADYGEVRWFLKQEVAGEAGFDDLVALTQLRMPVQAKLELARNYWDEMGRGRERAMHGPLLEKLAEEVNVCDTPNEEIVWESLALGNLLAGLAFNRRYAYHSIGALGAVELTAPTRAVKVCEALDRLGVSRKASYYFKLHATVDIVHARGWRDEVLIPILAQQPEVAIHIAEGALMRLNAGARTFDCYRRELGLVARDAFVP